jgi:drug/metabolite transporter superfamily protein YnfA
VTFHTVLKFIVGHVLAGAVVILGTLFVTFVCYIVALATAPHGIDTPVAVIPEFLTLMFMAGVVAVVASTGSFLLSVLLMWLRSKRHFPAWLPIAVIPLLALLVVLLIFGRTKDMGFVAVVTGGVFLYFGIYWTLLTSSAAVLDFIRRKLSGQKAA